MAQEEIGRPEREFDNFDDVFSSRLRERMRAETTSVPFSSPPRPVRLIMFELAREETRDEDLVNRALNEDNSDHSKDCMRGIPEFEEPLIKGRLQSSLVNQSMTENRTKKHTKNSKKGAITTQLVLNNIFIAKYSQICIPGQQKCL